MEDKKRVGIRNLRRLGACSGAREQFRSIFPHGGELTLENVETIVDEVSGEYIFWFLRRTISMRTADAWERRTSSLWTDYHMQKICFKDINKKRAKWLFNKLNEYWPKINAAMNGGDASKE